MSRGCECRRRGSSSTAESSLRSRERRLTAARSSSSEEVISSGDGGLGGRRYCIGIGSKHLTRSSTRGARAVALVRAGALRAGGFFPPLPPPSFR